MRAIEDLETFVTIHRLCGRIEGDAEAPGPDGYRLWIACVCGARLERAVTFKDASEDLVYSDLLVSPS